LKAGHQARQTVCRRVISDTTAGEAALAEGKDAHPIATVSVPDDAGTNIVHCSHAETE